MRGGGPFDFFRKTQPPPEPATESEVTESEPHNTTSADSIENLHILSGEDADNFATGMATKFINCRVPVALQAAIKFKFHPEDTAFYLLEQGKLVSHRKEGRVEFKFYGPHIPQQDTDGNWMENKNGTGLMMMNPTCPPLVKELPKAIPGATHYFDGSSDRRPLVDSNHPIHKVDWYDYRLQAERNTAAKQYMTVDEIAWYKGLLSAAEGMAVAIASDAWPDASAWPADIREYGKELIADYKKGPNHYWGERKPQNPVPPQPLHDIPYESDEWFAAKGTSRAAEAVRQSINWSD